MVIHFLPKVSWFWCFDVTRCFASQYNVTYSRQSVHLLIPSFHLISSSCVSTPGQFSRLSWSELGYHMNWDQPEYQLTSALQLQCITPSTALSVSLLWWNDGFVLCIYYYYLLILFLFFSVCFAWKWQLQNLTRLRLPCVHSVDSEEQTTCNCAIIIR